jgi:hypothetical protein
MDGLTLLARSLASMTMFALRPFLAAFALAAAARVGAEAAAATTLPAWLPGPLVQAAAVLNIAPASLLISDAVLLLLAVLALFELIALENDELQPYYEQTSAAARALTAFLVTFGLVDQQMTLVLRTLVLQGPAEPLVAVVSAGGGLRQALQLDWLPWLASGLTFLLAAVTAGGSWAIGALRSALTRLLSEFDSEDGLGLRGLLNRLDLLIGLFSMVLFWLLPVLGLLLALAVFGGLALLRLVIERRSAAGNVPCVQCRRPLPATAPFCAGCGSAQPAARQVGLFGFPLAKPMRDLAAQQFALISVRRCPHCAARLPQRTISQACPACATRTFADAGAVQRYLTRLDRRLPWVVVGCLVAGLIPLFGLVPGLILYRVGLIAGVSGYIDNGSGCLVRTAVNLLNALLIMLQPLPVIGAVTLPLLCLTNYAVYRGMLLRAAGGRSFGQ